LISKLKEISIERGCYKTVLNCNNDNIDFYNKCGFSIKGVEMCVYNKCNMK